MRKDTRKGISGILARYRRHRVWRKIVGALCCVVVFCTTYALILPAITLEKTPNCGKAEHIHTEACYTQVTAESRRIPICTLESLQLHTHTEECLDENGALCCGYGDFIVHTHDDSCFDENGELWCPLPEIEAHTHDESCFQIPEAHVHDESCYTRERGALICGIPEGEPAHTHSQEAGCFEEVRELVCPLEESEEHTHSGDCFEITYQLTCGISDQPHQHTDECYAWNEVLSCPLSTDPVENTEPVLICGKEEIILHEHTLEECFETDEDGNTYLVCTQVQILEHQHTDGCFQTVEEEADTTSLTCGREEGEGAHTHSVEGGCYDANGALICQEAESAGHQHGPLCYGTWILTCGQEEHTHSLACDSDPSADVETEEDWKQTLPELSGDWRQDLAAVARSQLGYAESEKNFTVDAQEHIHGYTRYGAWYGDPYADWNGLFVRFCASYANVPAEAALQGTDCQSWPAALNGGYHPADSLYMPQTGDLAFFDTDQDGEADRVGIVTGVSQEPTADIPSEGTAEGEETAQAAESLLTGIRVVQGGDACQVREQEYGVDAVLGYGALLPSGPLTQTVKGEDYTVTVTYGPEAALPEGAELAVRELTDAEYDQSCEMAREAMGVEELSFARFFDISFVADGESIEPAAPVEVQITYDHAEIPEDQIKRVVHITENGTELLETELTRNESETTFAFTQDSFSVVGTAAARAATPPEFTETVSPSSSVINVFDYWFPIPNATDFSVEGLRFPAGGDQGNALDNHEAGINTGHTLKFRTSSGGISFTASGNGYHGEGVTQGIVSRTLEDGYPKLSGDGAIVNGSTESLAYLFDPDYVGSETAYRKTFKDVQGLLYMEDGYYTYNSAEHYAYLKEENRASNSTETGNGFTLYDDWAVTATSTGNNGQFFPFNDYPEDPSINAKKMSHYFGLTLTARFIQEHDGYTNASHTTPTSFHFSGDDDVWIFIDDVLVADLGGIHDKISTTIDFSTGIVNVEKVYTGSTYTTIYDAFVAAGRADEESWTTINGNRIFANNTSHTLKFFYMERGNNESNMSLQYNLNEVPPTAIYKINQYGDPVGGASFEVYRCDDSWNITGGPVYSGTTNSNGEMIFTDSDGSPYAIGDLKTIFGEQFILKETSVPNGYRKVTDEIRLRIYNNALVCENTYDSGVWATPTLQVTAPNTLTLVSGGTQPYYNGGSGTETGTLFAVVLKYIGTDGVLTNQQNWAPVSGNPTDGYSVTKVPAGGDFTAAAIQAAQAYGTQNVFVKSPNGGMQAILENIPGKVIDYYHMLAEGEKDQTQYTVAYYWTQGTLGDANSGNTYRVDAEDSTNAFYRVFGATIEVPNLANRLLVQKYAEDGVTLVNGASFALFPANADGTYQGDIDLSGCVYVDADPADLQDGQYTFSVTDAAGDTMGSTVLTAMIGGEKKTVSSHEQRTTNSLVLEGSDGTCVFGIRNVSLSPGCYYLREVKAPLGYALNTASIMVRVTDSAIYANAGTADDGVTVARGPGYIVSPLHKAASEGDVDNTLTWIYQKLRVYDSGTYSFDDVLSAPEASWHYATNAEGLVQASYLHYTREAKPLATTRYVTNYEVDEESQRPAKQGTARTHTQLISTDVGWSYNELYQDYDYGAAHAGSANYEDLRENGGDGDITNLFSRSVYVQVTDEKVSNLEISKKVEAKEGAAVDEDEIFSFTLALEDASGTPLGETVEGQFIPALFDYQIYDIDGNGVRQPAAPYQDAEGNWIPASGQIGHGMAIRLKTGQTAAVEKLPTGTAYTVTEEVNERFTTTYVRTDDASVDSGTGNTATGTLFWRLEGETLHNTSTVAFTNTPAPDLTVYKVESGNERKFLQGAAFTLSRVISEDSRSYYAYEEVSGKTTWVTDPEKASVLQTDGDGRLILHTIPDGTYFLAETKAPDGYYPLAAPIKITVAEGVISQATMNGQPVPCGEDKLSLTVVNYSGQELPDTGGAGTTLYTMAGLFLVGAACLLYCKKRNGKEGPASS